ncbi:MAG TPA: FkbM family methyltransferase [Terriglobales bacterium]
MLPLLRLSPRQSLKVLHGLGADWSRDRQWQTVQPRYRSYFDRQLRCVMTADLADWAGRSCYYWGRFFDLTHQAVLRQFLAPGDTYIDIGANIGYQSLYASRLVGPDGLVLSFEPNPATYAVLAGHVAINRIQNCRTFPLALDEQAGEATLAHADRHSGSASLRPLGQPAAGSATVAVRTGDQVLKDIVFPGRAFLKIDVEGFEQRVLLGLRDTLARVSAVAVEITPKWLNQLGGNAEDLHAYMRQAGFRPLVPSLRWRLGLWGAHLELAPRTQPDPEQHDLVFAR